MNREELKKEAVKRLEILTRKGLMPVVKNDFVNEGVVHVSEYNGVIGALYYFNELGGFKQDILDLVKNFEEENGGLVYHITHEYTDFGELFDLFYVSKYKEEWKYDNADLEDNYSLVKCINVTHPDFSELGTIGFKCIGGGLVRTC